MFQERPTSKSVGRRRQRHRLFSPRKSKLREASSVVEGRNPVLETLRSGRTINRLLLNSGLIETSVITDILRLAGEVGISAERVDRRIIEGLSVTGKSQGVIAIVAAQEYVNLEDLLKIGSDRDELPFLVLLDGVQDPHNLGAIIRTADAAGVHGIVIPARRAVGLTVGVARSSAGAVEHMKVARVANLSNAMLSLKKDKVWSVGIDPDANIDYREINYRDAICVVMGSEGNGMSRLVKERCDILVSIPMRGRLASLNVSVAAALVMYEAMHQRNLSM